MAVDALGLNMGFVMLIVSIVVGAFFLWLSAKMFKLRDKTFVTPLMIAAIVAIVGFVFGLIPLITGIVSTIVTAILAIWLVKSKYKVDWGKAILVWLVYYIMLIVVFAIVRLLFVGSMAGLGMIGMMR